MKSGEDKLLEEETSVTAEHPCKVSPVINIKMKTGITLFINADHR